MIVCDRCGAGRDGAVLSCRVDIKLSYGMSVIGGSKCDNKDLCLECRKEFSSTMEKAWMEYVKARKAVSVEDSSDF